MEFINSIRRFSTPPLSQSLSDPSPQHSFHGGGDEGGMILLSNL